MVRDENNIAAAKRAIDRAAGEAVVDLSERTLDAIDDGFDHGTDALGRPWAPLSEETIRRKGHNQILVDTGAMRESIDAEADRSRKIARIGSNSEILPYHELGVPENNLPARPVLRPGLEWASRHARETFATQLDAHLSTVL